jgi:molybdopterin converting factor small subunit
VSEVDVPALRKPFRAVIAEAVRVQTSHLQAANVDELYSQIISKTNMLRSYVAVATTEPSNVTQRLLTRLHHLQGKLQHIKELGVFPKDVTPSHYSELQERLSSMERELELPHTSDSTPNVREEVESGPELKREAGTDLRNPVQRLVSESNEGVSTKPALAQNHPAFRPDYYAMASTQTSRGMSFTHDSGARLSYQIL